MCSNSGRGQTRTGAGSVSGQNNIENQPSPEIQKALDSLSYESNEVIRAMNVNSRMLDDARAVLNNPRTSAAHKRKATIRLNYLTRNAEELQTKNRELQARVVELRNRL